MSPISVTIEMPVFLKKYLIGQSENKTEPIEFSHGHDYNILLTRLVSNDTSIKPVDSKVSAVKIKLPFTGYKDVYFYNKISIENRALFREQIKRDMYYDLRLFIKDCIISGEERKIAIETFFFYYKITDDDVNYQSFYRNFTRFIEKRRQILGNIVLPNFKLENVHRFKHISNG